MEGGPMNMLGTGTQQRGSGSSTQLVNDIIATFETLRQRNKDLEEQNARLVAALDEANERWNRLEQAAITLSQLSKFAVSTATQGLSNAVEALEASRRSTEETVAELFEEARKRALDLHLEGVAVLAKARDDLEVRHREPDARAIEILNKTSESIQSTSGALGKLISVPETAATLRPTAKAEETQSLPAHEQYRRVHANAQGQQCLDSILSAGQRLAPQSTPKVGVESTDSAPPTTIEKTADLSKFLEQRLREVASSASAASFQDAALPNGTIQSQQPEERSRPVAEPMVEMPQRGAVECIELVASPFYSFASLSTFIQALRQLPGVVAVTALGLEGTVLRVSVNRTKSHSAAPMVSLIGLLHFNLRLVSVATDRVEIVLLDNQVPSGN